jgi:hypothetical protein
MSPGNPDVLNSLKFLFSILTVFVVVLDLVSEHVMQVEWEKAALQELDITATDLSTECLIDMLTRIPNLRFLSAGQLNGFNDSVSTLYRPQSNVVCALSFLT